MLAATLLALAACQREAPVPKAPSRGDNTRPAQAVLLLTRHLRENDLVAFTRDAVPPGLHARLDVAWQAGRTRWPLEELPFDERFPTLLASLSQPGAEDRLQRVFDQQFSGAHAEIKAAARTLGLFGVQYVQHDDDYSEAERDHYAQFIAALSQWAAQAPLGDPGRARTAIPQLTRAARATRLGSEAAFAEAGMQRSLRRLGPFVATGKTLLAGYGLDLDESLDGLQATLQAQTGDSARVRMQYTLGGQPIDVFVDLKRRKGRWYLAEYLRRAEAAVTPAPAQEAARAAPPG
ncbi:hypothetical protein GCM10023332_04850 [Luteimonas vadosa]|uniref:Lipoprotein n=1 Tax=Luteimonas vadosa TaxID=1165507 RepID=A0ABP9DPY0_9GAMM